jgi:hypothetical protein
MAPLVLVEKMCKHDTPQTVGNKVHRTFKLPVDQGLLQSLGIFGWSVTPAFITELAHVEATPAQAKA